MSGNTPDLATGHLLWQMRHVVTCARLEHDDGPYHDILELQAHAGAVSVVIKL